jgi:acetyl esterase/lipase
METSMGLEYGRHDDTSLLGDLYLPQGSGSHLVIVAVHGGGWQANSRDV